MRIMQDFLKRIIKEAGALGLSYYGNIGEIQTKSGPNDYVTEADIAVSDFLISQISSQYPDHAIVSEESVDSINEGAEWEWVIDPIDGTSNFAHGIPVWSVIIAVLHKGNIVYGAMYNPIADDLYFAHKDHGAWKNGGSLAVSSLEDLSTAKFHATFNIRKSEGERCVDFATTVMRDLRRGTPRRVSGVSSMAYVAAGAGDVFFGNGGKDHDYLAPALFCEEAGAVVTDMYGNPWTRHTENILVANPALHKQCLSLLSS